MKLTLPGSGNTNFEQFNKLIIDLPAPYNVILMDAYQTDRSVLVLAKMSWSTWACLSMVFEFHPIGVAIGPSLLGTALAPASIKPSQENLPLRSK